MGCSGCSCGTTEGGRSGKPGGCNSNGCSSGGCNRRNTYDWIAALGIDDPTPYPFVEVSFKNGSRKEFFKNPVSNRTVTGDFVLVDTPKGGYDLGKISLSGELVRLQMKKKRIKNDSKLQSVIRKAHERDLERLDEVRAKEKDTLIQARAIARSLGLNMKIGDIEYQGDGRKVTIYYTADNRVDFRELIRHYHKDFNVKIEMRQIGARQESSRIGGLGNCGRELCCSTWLSDFKSVNTAAARYQNLAINQIKLTGMCGRLKCCLNYELDAYVDALEEFPDRAERFKTSEGNALLIKTDVFKRLMFYTYENNRGRLYPLHIDQVWEVQDMLKSGKMPQSLAEIEALRPKEEVEAEDTIDFENVHNVIDLPMEAKKKKKKKKRKGGLNLKSELEEGAGGNAQQGQQRPPQRPQGNDQNRPGGHQQRGQNRPPQRNTGGQERPDRGGQDQQLPRNNGGQDRPNRGQNQQPRNQQQRPPANPPQGGGGSDNPNRPNNPNRNRDRNRDRNRNQDNQKPPTE